MTFLSRIAAGVVATSLVLSAPSAFALELRISSASPPVSPLISAFEIIKERMEAAYPGDITVSIHHSSSLFKQGTELPAMQRGNLEMATPNVYEIEQQLPEYGALGMPYIFRDVDHMLAVFRGDIGDQYIADVQAKMGIVILDTGYLGTRTVGLRTARNVKSPDDLAGIKLRMPPGAAYQNLATALGATPVSMPATEVYLALKTGAIDGQDNPLNIASDWKFNEVTAEFALTNHVVQPIFLAISGLTWAKLSPEQQTTLKAAAREGADVEIEMTRKQETDARAAFKAAGVIISTPDLAPFHAKVDALYAQPGKMDAWMPGLVDRIKAID